MDYNWGKAFFASLDFPHLGYHSEDDVDIVGDSVVWPSGVLELGHYPTFVFAVTLHFKSSLNTVICKPVFFLLELYIILNTSHQFTEMSWHKGRDFTESIIVQRSWFCNTAKSRFIGHFQGISKAFLTKTKTPLPKKYPLHLVYQLGQQTQVFFTYSMYHKGFNFKLFLCRSIIIIMIKSQIPTHCMAMAGNSQNQNCLHV